MMARIEVKTSDVAMTLHIARPGADIRGGVVVVQEAFGVTSYIESICDRLTTEGRLAVAPALFHRQGSPVLSYDDFKSAMPLVKTLGAA